MKGAWTVPGKRPSSGWPENGAINFVSYSTRYRPGLDLVLKGLTFNISGGEKVGIGLMIYLKCSWD